MKKPTLKQALWILGGAIGGFAWYYFVGCASGACPISSNPYVSTGYGALMGLLLAGNTAKRQKAKPE